MIAAASKHQSGAEVASYAPEFIRLRANPELCNIKVSTVINLAIIFPSNYSIGAPDRLEHGPKLGHECRPFTGTGDVAERLKAAVC